jgi:hypothetical protein
LHHFQFIGEAPFKRFSLSYLPPFLCCCSRTPPKENSSRKKERSSFVTLSLDYSPPLGHLFCRAEKCGWKSGGSWQKWKYEFTERTYT